MTDNSKSSTIQKFRQLRLKSIACTTAIVFFSTLLNAAEVPPKPVKVDTVVEMSINATNDLNGTVHSRAHIPMTAGVNGRLAWLAEPGEFVHQGDVIIKMDLLPLQLKQAEQQSQIKRENINLAYYKNELIRLEKLRVTNSTSQFTLDQTRSKYELAQADLEIAQLKLRQIEEQLSKATIRAPFDGVITKRFVRAGTDVSRSAPLLKLLDTEQLEVRLFVPIKYLAHIQKGKELNLKANGQQINAPVKVKIPSADPRSQTFEVRITIPEHLNESWAAGQLVRVTIPIQASTPTLTVRRDALILRKDGIYVVKIDTNNKVHRLPVTVGKGSVERVSVQGSLQHGDKVAIRGAERLKDGEEVKIQ
jgi:RND family efflux transporter MFP subunit